MTATLTMLMVVMLMVVLLRTTVTMTTIFTAQRLSQQSGFGQR